MKCRYIILLGGIFNANHTPLLKKSLREAGMVCALESVSAKLFVSAETQTVAIPGYGVLIGRTFTKDGHWITPRLDFDGSASELTNHLLQNVWGEYLSLHIGGKDRAEITLLRDPSGAVPCVYAIDNGEGFITSDIGLAVELGAYQREVDWQAIAHSLNFPYLKTTRTALKRVSELLPGSTLSCRAKVASVVSAWSPWRFVESGVRHEDPHVAAQDVQAAVSGVVEALSSVDDGFVVELSGGLDSSVVAACLHEASARTIFCTLVMPVAGTDERPYARLMTDSLGQKLFPVEVGFENVRFEYAVPPSSVLPAIGILQHAINEVWESAGNRYGVNSFFSGAGGDSVFCYLKTAAPAADAFIERGAKAGIAAILDLSSLHRCTVWKAGRLAFKKLRRRSPSGWKADTTLLNPDCLTAAPDYHSWLDAPTDALPGDREKIYDLIGTQLFRDATPRGAGRSMHFPLLAQPVMEACLKVPTWMWIRDGRNRAIARDAFTDLLPSGILDRRSKGSYTGYMAAVYARNKLAMRQFLEEGQLCAHDLIDRPSLTEFFARKLAPRDLSFLRIFDLCAAENWVRHQSQDPP